MSAYLERRGIVVEKTGDHTLLVLFSVGITKGKWGTLIDALIDFKNAYDGGVALAEVLPGFGRPGCHCGSSVRGRTTSCATSSSACSSTRSSPTCPSRS